MKVFVVALLALASIACAEISTSQASSITAYGYLQNYAIPAAERIRKAEENAASRIVGGVPAGTGQYAYQVCH